MEKRQYSTDFRDWLDGKGAKIFIFPNLLKQEHIKSKSYEEPFELFAKYSKKRKKKAMSRKPFIIEISDSESNSSDEQVKLMYYIFDYVSYWKNRLVLLTSQETPQSSNMSGADTNISESTGCSAQREQVSNQNSALSASVENGVDFVLQMFKDASSECSNSESELDDVSLNVLFDFIVRNSNFKMVLYIFRLDLWYGISLRMILGMRIIYMVTTNQMK